MQFFQQEEYDNLRFLKYVYGNSKLIDKKLSLSLILSSVVLLILNQNSTVYSLIYALILLFFGHQQIKLTRQNSKKSLALTARVKRIFAIFFLLLISLIAGVYCQRLVDNPIIFLLYVLLSIQALALLLVISNLILQPYEKYTQNTFLKEAKQKIRELKPITIGITGSYGKTSTKHILSHILSFVAPTLATPGSVNTPMGVTRIIREQLKKEHKYFIAEMGAYGIGSIKRLCDLTPPHFGILTAVGNAHYERFKSVENVAQAKFELNQAVNHNQGKTFINGDGVDQKFVKKYGQNIILVGTKNVGADGYKITEVKQAQAGLELKIEHKKAIYHLKSPLFGTHHAHNIALSFALAHNLGIASETIIAALKSVPQIKHRLEIIEIKNSATIIDDAYNSNPTGFASALEILKLLKKKDGKAILITPGMVELGELHDLKHQEIALKALANVDIAVVIMPQRIQSFVKTFKQKMTKSQQLIEFESFLEAKKWLDQSASSKDVILYENDLPDLYENKISF